MAEQKVPYQVDGRQFEGMIVHGDGVQAKRPAIFMQPDWKGVCADTIAQARIVAGKDYVVLMADMFGAGYGDKPKTREQLAAGMRAVHDDLAFTIACGGKACDTLLAEAGRLGLVDAAKTAAIGYCAGGGFALEQARAGADFKAVVVFHVTEYGDARSSLPRFAPSSLNCTPTTPTLSAALAVTDSDPDTVDPPAGPETLTVGGVVSGGGPLLTVTDTDEDVVMLPAASLATAVNV
jgi:dienelactone hydrolase